MNGRVAKVLRGLARAKTIEKPWVNYAWLAHRNSKGQVYARSLRLGDCGRKKYLGLKRAYALVG